MAHIVQERKTFQPSAETQSPSAHQFTRKILSIALRAQQLPPQYSFQSSALRPGSGIIRLPPTASTHEPRRRLVAPDLLPSRV
jgi:hypothetical protein